MYKASSFVRQLRAIAPVLLLVLLVMPWHLSFGQDEDVNRVLLNLLTKVEAMPSGHEREVSGNEMFRYAVKLEKPAIATIDDQTIDRIAKLLLDTDSSVKWYAAKSLGHFGIRARRALPALRYALYHAKTKELIIVVNSADPISTMEEAISFIEQSGSE